MRDVSTEEDGMRSVRRLVLLMVLVTWTGPLAAAEGAPPQPTPEHSSVSCPASFNTTDGREPVLLVHGTAVTTEEDWGWNYLDALPEQGFDVCAVELPDRALGDIQEAALHVVDAIRHVHRVSGEPVDVLGHSQGGLEPRWAVKWWADAPEMVDDLVTLASPHHGTYSADYLCVGECPPAVWQMQHGSDFLSALNRHDETPGRIDYTSVYSLTDDLVQPASTAELGDAGPEQDVSNVLIQDLCPGRPVHHAGIVHDPVAYAAVHDALTGSGAADVERFFGPELCLERMMPGTNEVDAVGGNLILYGNGFVAFGQAERTDSEPPVRDYASS